MINLKKRLFVLIILISISFLLLALFKKYYLPNPQKSKQNTSLDKTLIEDVTIKNLVVDNKTYHYNKGEITSKQGQPLSKKEEQKIRQLVFFYITVKEDPLFTSPDLDTEKIKKSLNLLKLAEDKYNQVTKAQRILFPTAFLENIPKIVQTEKKFLINPSDALANELSLLYQETAKDYQNGIDSFISASQESLKDSQMRKFTFILSATTPDILLSDFKKISENAQILDQEVTRRIGCLKSGLDCYRPQVNFPSKFIEAETTQYSFKMLNKDILFRVFTDGPQRQAKGPYIAPSGCFGWDENFQEINLPFYIFPPFNGKNDQKTLNHPGSLQYKLATENFYSKVARQSWEANYPEKLSRVFQLETADYMCADLEYQAKLATLDYFFTTYKNQPILNKIIIPDAKTLKQMQNFESVFLSSSLPSYRDLEQLANYYAYLYTITDDQSLKDELLNRYLVINRRLSYLPLRINSAVASLARVILEEQKSPGFSTQKNMLPYIYFFRSSWNIFYFPYSPSFWRSNKRLDYLEKRHVTEATSSSHILTHGQMLKEYTPEEIKQIEEASLKYNTQPLLY